MTPQIHKMAVLTWLVVYPLITVLILILEPLIRGLPVPVRTLFLTLIMVPCMVYVAMPAAKNRFKRWLEPNPSHPKNH